MLCSPNGDRKSGKIMLKCFQSNLTKCIVNFEINMKNLKKN